MIEVIQAYRTLTHERLAKLEGQAVDLENDGTKIISEALGLDPNSSTLWSMGVFDCRLVYTHTGIIVDTVAVFKAERLQGLGKQYCLEKLIGNIEIKLKGGRK